MTRLYSILDSGVHSTSSSTNTTVQFDGGAGGGASWKRTHRQFASDTRLARSVASSPSCQLDTIKVPGYLVVPRGIWVYITGYLEVYTDVTCEFSLATQ